MSTVIKQTEIRRLGGRETTREAVYWSSKRETRDLITHVDVGWEQSNKRKIRDIFWLQLCMGEKRQHLYTKNSSWLPYFKLQYLWLLSCHFCLCWCLEPPFVLFFARFRLIATLGPPRLLVIWFMNNWHMHDTVTVDPLVIEFYSWKVTEGHLIQPITFQMRKWSMERLHDCAIDV